MEDILFSIIMPTYNSEKTIERALQSIRNQDISQECIEILVIDGGSTDKTLEIARKYGANILNNPKRFPEYAKRIGFTRARGRWVIKQDSDEVLSQKDQLRKRKEFFEKNPEVYCLLADRMIPGGNSGIASTYVNWMGDPFSYVVYNLSDSIVKSQKRYLAEKKAEGNIYYYYEEDIVPIGDAGTTTIDMQKAKSLFGEEIFSQEFVISGFLRLVQKTHLVGCIPNDQIIHYSGATLYTYLKKLDFRVYTNLYDVKQSGYSQRSKESKKLRKRKIVFVFYVASIILPFLDAVRMAIVYKDASLLLHFFYTYYLVVALALGIVKKCLGISYKNPQYGK